jgi:hypothetical protein
LYNTEIVASFIREFQDQDSESPKYMEIIVFN